MANLFFSILLSWTFIRRIILLIISINTNKEAERTRQQQIMMQMSGKQGSSDMFNPFHKLTITNKKKLRKSFVLTPKS